MLHRAEDEGGILKVPGCRIDVIFFAPTGPPYTGRHLGERMDRIRRGGGRVVRGRDACVALAGGGKRAQEQDEGDASVPSPRPHHSRPYECDDLPPKSLPLKAGVGMMRGGDACVALVLLP